MRFISRFGRFYEECTLPFTLSLSLSLSIPFTSLSLSPLYLSLTLFSLPPSLYLSFYLSFSLSPSFSLLSIILFDVSNGRFRPCCLIIGKCSFAVIGYILVYRAPLVISYWKTSKYLRSVKDDITCINQITRFSFSLFIGGFISLRPSKFLVLRTF